ncbi:MAG: preprotein translocase subunit SecA [Armatimonadetes bacterium]|nr:preprotein translocase subunit SecA [Armatimonadota bacterium]MDE2206251.1 preprotein translocase subunit SecA [Armatimonadota bacterium]
MTAIPSLINRFFDSTARDIARYRQVVLRINALEPEYERLSDEQIGEKTAQLRERVQTEYKPKYEAAAPSWDQLNDQQKRDEDRRIFDPILDAVLPEAFALVREASKRTLGLRHYDVQMIGGMVLHDGRIAEMRTGEGKTLVATCPIFLNALLGKGAHLVTVNDYLSKRDAIWNGPIYHLLGMTLGIIQGQSPETGDEGGSYIYDPEYELDDPRHAYARPCERHEAYMCDITYGTNNEFGFDYLRDNMEFSAEGLRQRERQFAIVDEVDSILIDEARTPLIISGMVEQSSDMYRKIDDIVARMKRGVDDPKGDKDNPDADKHNPNVHYIVDEKQKTSTITDAGVAFVEKALNTANLADDRELMHYLTPALKAHGVSRRDVDYVVKDVGKGMEIIIVDENTGRLMYGRRYNDGLHQALEAKEHVEIKHESQTLATITFQNYFRLYTKLAGMTGTAKTEEDEFRKIYALDVVEVPTNKPVVRKDHADVVYKLEEHKFRGIAAEVLRLYCKQQPVLVGTRSIEMSERVSALIQPAPLSTLCLLELLRVVFEETKSVSGEQRKAYTAQINKPLSTLSVVGLKPLCRELRVEPDPLAPLNMNRIAEIFEVADSGLEYLEEALTHGIPHNILNAKFHEQEAVVIAEAGRKGGVTIATNMAGRGVDILLGGMRTDVDITNVDGSAGSLKAAEKTAEASDVNVDADEQGGEDGEAAENTNFRRGGRPRVLEAVISGALSDEEHKRLADEVCKLGGLFILGTERHESRRIDNQLRGRSGRQGDPGESRFFVSMEDELWRLFGDKVNNPLLRTWEDHLSMNVRLLSRMIERAQKKVEEHYFEARKYTLDYDDVMNRQREVIYKERRRILLGEDLKETVLHYIRETIVDAVALYAPADAAPHEWELDHLYRELDEYFMLAPAVTLQSFDGKTRDQIEDFLQEHVLAAYESRDAEFQAIQPGAMRDLERWMALRAINASWMEHLANMDYLREGIQLRGYEQKDPLLIYQKEAFDEFERMQAAIQDDIVRQVFRVQIVAEPPQGAQPPPLGQIPDSLRSYNQTDDFDAIRDIEMSGGGLSRPEAVRKDGAPADWKGGRNDPCWCGSGLKYKKCHGK